MALPVNEAAVEAFELKDANASRAAHDKRSLEVAREPHTQEQGEFIKNIIFGGLDGIITTFAIVAGVYGASYPSEVVLVLGFANLLADAVSMAVGEYLSSKAEREYMLFERQREQWEMDNYPEGEKREMEEIYVKRHGFSESDAKLLIGVMSSNTKFFVDHMCVEELGIIPPGEEDTAAKEGAVTFFSFLTFGFLPLVAYLIFDSDKSDEAFALASSLTAVVLFLLGIVKGYLAGRNNMLGSAFGILFNGTLAALAAFFVSWGLSEVAQVEECI